jgi:hypothetical protein
LGYSKIPYGWVDWQPSWPACSSSFPNFFFSQLLAAGLPFGFLPFKLSGYELKILGWGGVDVYPHFIAPLSFREFLLSETGLPTTVLGMAAMLADASPNKAEVSSEQEASGWRSAKVFWEVPSPTRQAQGVPEKELVAREVDGDELRPRFLGRHGRAFEYGEGTGACAPEELRGQRQEELVG